MTKQEMLDTIDNLIVALSPPTSTSIGDLLDRRVSLLSRTYLEACYKDSWYDYYRDNPDEFTKDFYWEFVDDENFGAMYCDIDGEKE